MKTDTRHQCDGFCVCPIHQTPLVYRPAGDQHACQRPDCEHAHGLPKDQTPGTAEWYLSGRGARR